MCATTAIRQGPSTKVIISACPDSLDHPDMRCHAMPRDASSTARVTMIPRSRVNNTGLKTARIRGIHSFKGEARSFERSAAGCAEKKGRDGETRDRERRYESVETRRTPGKRHLRTEACTRHRDASQGRRKTAAPRDVLNQIREDTCESRRYATSAEFTRNN